MPFVEISMTLLYHNATGFEKRGKYLSGTRDGQKYQDEGHRLLENPDLICSNQPTQNLRKSSFGRN